MLYQYSVTISVGSYTIGQKFFEYKVRLYMHLRAIAVGLASFIPGVYKRFSATGGTRSAEYCYSVWMRHLIRAYRNKLTSTVPQHIAEFGPGDSLGTGFAALISGSESYTALDLVEYANPEQNLAIFDELVELFKCRSPIPQHGEFSDHTPSLDSYEFPVDILTSDILEASLKPERIKLIRDNIKTTARSGQGEIVKYAVPWTNNELINRGSVDMILSHAVLEHVDELAEAYQCFNQWLNQGGFISHVIDYRSHGITKEWNGHWAISNFEWQLIRGGRPFLINRQPYSTHKRMAEAVGFDLKHEELHQIKTGISRHQLAETFDFLSDSDLETHRAFVQAIPRQPN